MQLAERGYWYMRDKSVQLLFGILILVSLSGKAHTDAVRHILTKRKSSWAWEKQH